MPRVEDIPKHFTTEVFHDHVGPWRHRYFTPVEVLGLETPAPHLKGLEPLAPVSVDVLGTAL